MPVTFFICVGLLGWFVVIVLTAKPKQNEVVIAKTINAAFFILSELVMYESFTFISSRYFRQLLPTKYINFFMPDAPGVS